MSLVYESEEIREDTYAESLSLFSMKKVGGGWDTLYVYVIEFTAFVGVR